MVRSLLFQAQDILPSSSRNCPVCVHFSTQDPSKVFACNILPSSLRSQLSNKTSYKPFGGHLSSQPGQNFRLRFTGPNPAKGRIKVVLGNDPWAIRSEILWHGILLTYLSSHMAKAQVKDLLGLLLSGQKYKGNPLYPVACTRLYLVVLLV